MNKKHEISTVDDLLTALRLEPDARHVVVFSDEYHVAGIVRDESLGSSDFSGDRFYLPKEIVSFVLRDSPAAKLLQEAEDAYGNGAISGGDPILWAALPIRSSHKICGVWLLPEHPESPCAFPG